MIAETSVLFVILLIVFLVPPHKFVVVIIFLGLLVLAVAIPVYVATKHWRRSFFVGFVVSGILGLRALGVGNVLNALLLIAAIAAFEVYFTKSVD